MFCSLVSVFFFFSGFPVCGCCVLSVLLPSLVDVLTGMNWAAAVGYSDLVTGVWRLGGVGQCDPQETWTV